MIKFKKILTYFSPFEWALWLISLAAVLISFFACGNKQYLYMIGSLLGATCLIFVAKGNVIGQFLSVIFSVFYGIVSYSFSYYGEMITYLGMTAPIAVAAIITWLKHPFGEGKREVEVNKLGKREYLIMVLANTVITVAFYFILGALKTSNLLFSTLSVFTSFAAVYLSMRRSPFYALAYAANDVVLIILWSLATAQDKEYLSMVICFSVFLFNDIYGFINWTKIRKRQAAIKKERESDKTIELR